MSTIRSSLGLRAPSVRQVWIAVAVSAGGAVARYIFTAHLGIGSPLLIIHVFAIAVVAEFFGMAPGLISTLASFGLILYQVSPIPDPMTLLLFLVLGISLSAFGGMRLQTERELRHIGYNLQTAEHIANVGSWESYVEGAVWWSPQTYDIFGLAPGTRVTVEDFFGMVHPDDVERVRAAARRAVDSGADYHIEHRIVRRSDGQIRHVHQRAKVAVNGVTRLIGSVQDITEAWRSKDELERVSRTMRLALEAGNSGAWTWNLRSGELIWSDTYYRILGVDPHVKPTLEFFFSLVYPSDAKHLKKSMDDAISGRTREFHIDFRVQRADGLRWLERRGHVLFDQAGKPVEVVGITTDITERQILRGLVPTCAQCKKIRDEANRWQPMEAYITQHSDVRFSHGLCPDCLREWEHAEEMAGTP